MERFNSKFKVTRIPITGKYLFGIALASFKTVCDAVFLVKQLSW